MFGIGGSEWLVIATVIIALLLVPGALVFGAGFLLGKKSGERHAETARDELSETAEVTSEAGPTDTDARTDGDTDV